MAKIMVSNTVPDRTRLAWVYIVCKCAETNFLGCIIIFKGYDIFGNMCSVRIGFLHLTSKTSLSNTYNHMDYDETK